MSCSRPLFDAGGITVDTPDGVTHAPAAPVPDDNLATVVSAAPRVGSAEAEAPQRTLTEGVDVGSRYRILKLLGRGGMGAVYLAHDDALDRQVALKVIRPEIAANREVLERFKQEIQLSSRVTNKNVLRVYDLGESQGLKYVTMQYVDGEDLAGLIRREGRLPLVRLLGLFRQICLGLQAAHEQNVIHRDLKPQNIMIDSAGTAYLTDFGLAKLSGQGAGMTQTGAVLGTPYYMSPEQVKGSPVDHRADIYSLGIILYEMASGVLPYREGSIYEIMVQRLQRAPRPIGELNPEVPPYLRKILDRCLAVEPAARYQSVAEILADLDATAVRHVRRPSRGTPRWLVPAAAAGAVLAVSGVGWFFVHRAPATVEEAGKAQSVLIADFDNQTGEAVFDGTLEPALGLAMEGASFITSFNRGQARKIAEQLQPGEAALTEARARLVAVREGISVVTSGAIERAGSGYRVSVRAVDAVTGKPIIAATEQIAGKQAALTAATRLAARIRGALGDTTPESLQLAAGETYGAASLDAAHEYGMGMEAQFAGKWDEAVARYQHALQLDPNLGRAYVGLAVIENNRGRHQEAEKYFKQALAHVDRMSDREKYRSRGAYYLTVNRDADRAIEELGALVRQFPADNAGLANLAVAYQLKRDFGKALEYGRRAIAIYPKNVPQRNNVGLFAMYSGDFDAAAREQQAVLQENPRFVQGYTGLALSQLAGGHRDDAAATWKKLETLGADGASVAAEGLGDLALYEGRAGDAVALLAPVAARDLQNDPDAAARKYLIIAEAHLLAGRASLAVTAAGQALQASTDERTAFGAGRVFAAAGDTRKALALAADLEKRLEPEPRMLGALVHGDVDLARGDSRAAIDRFRGAVKLVDCWLAHAALGRAYLQANAYAEADEELDRCVKRRGEATDVYLDVIPTLRYLPPVYYQLGRAREGLNSPAAAESFRQYLALRGAGSEDLQVPDARRRLGGK